MMGLRARLDAALTRLGVGEYLSLDCRDGNCDACDTCSHNCDHLAAAIRAALDLHPKVTLYTSGSTDPKHVPDSRSICGLCRDGWPCATVRALS